MFDFKSLIDTLRRRSTGEISILSSPTKILGQLAPSEVLAALAEIVREVAAVNHDPKLKIKERFRSLLYFDEKVQTLADLMIVVFRGDQVVEGVSPRHVLPTLLACWQEMATAYKTSLKQYYEAPNRQLAAQAEIATVRALEYYSRQATWAYLRYHDTEPRVWRNLHQMYQIAENAGFADKPIQWCSKDTESASPSEIYLRAVLLYLAEPARRLPQQIWQLSEWMKHWTNELKVEINLRPREQMYAVNVDEPRPPMRMRRNMVGERYRYFDTSRLAARLAIEGKQARAGDFSPTLGPINANQMGATAQLLLDLSLIWSREGQARRRRYERIGTGRSAEVVQGLQDIAKLLIGFAQVNLDATIKPFMGVELVEWTLEDESQIGVGANYRAHYDDRLSVGELVAIRDDAAKRPTIGIVRRLHKTRDNRVRAGIEKLGTQPSLVTIHKDDRIYPALFSQDAPQATGQRGLLLGNHLYGENREFTMTASNKSYRIRLGEALESLPHYTLCSFWVVEKF